MCLHGSQVSWAKLDSIAQDLETHRELETFLGQKTPARNGRINVLPGPGMWKYDWKPLHELFQHIGPGRSVAMGPGLLKWL